MSHPVISRVSAAACPACLCLALLTGPAVRCRAETSAPRGSTASDLGQADRLAQTGRPAEALALYRLIGESGVSPEVRASGWLKAGRLTPEARTAESFFRKSSEAAPGSVTGAEAVFEMGRLYYAEGNYRAADQALASAQGALNRTSSASPVLLFRARTALAAGFHDAAASAYRVLSGQRAWAQQGTNGLAQALLQAGDAGGALAAFERSAQSYPAGDQAAVALAGAARAAQKAGNPDRVQAARARLGVVAPASFEFQDLGPAPLAPLAAKPDQSKGQPVASPERKAEVTAQPERKVIATPDSGAWYIQLGIFGERANAEALLRRARAGGIVAVLDAAPGPKGPMFQVHTLGYGTREEAGRAAARLKAEGFATQVKSR